MCWTCCFVKMCGEGMNTTNARNRNCRDRGRSISDALGTMRVLVAGRAGRRRGTARYEDDCVRFEALAKLLQERNPALHEHLAGLLNWPQGGSAANRARKERLEKAAYNQELERPDREVVRRFRRFGAACAAARFLARGDRGVWAPNSGHMRTFPPARVSVPAHGRERYVVDPRTSTSRLAAIRWPSGDDLNYSHEYRIKAVLNALRAVPRQGDANRHEETARRVADLLEPHLARRGYQSFMVDYPPGFRPKSSRYVRAIHADMTPAMHRCRRQVRLGMLE